SNLKTVPASGTITYQGKPLEKGKLQFVPKEAPAASATIENGRFTIQTFGDNDGAVPGKYQVGVIVTEEAPPKKKGFEPSIKYVVLEKMANPQTSNLEVTIPPGGSDQLKIDIPDATR